MPLSVAKNIKKKLDNTHAEIIQLYRNIFHAIGKHINVLIHLSSDQLVHHCINIVIVDIEKACNVLLSRDWSNKITRVFFYEVVKFIAII